jgi:hypothetical protein
MCVALPPLRDSDMGERSAYGRARVRVVCLTRALVPRRDQSAGQGGGGFRRAGCE